MNYSDVLNNARQCIGKYCKACPVCNGVACKNQVPGPGAKGVGDTAIRNYNKWADIRVNMDTLCENGTPDTHVELFGQSFKYPFFAGPVGAVSLHYSDAYTDMTYNDVLVRACAENGITAFTGDGTNPDVMTMATKAIGAANGCGVPTIKPWNIDTIKAKEAGAAAIVVSNHGGRVLDQCPATAEVLPEIAAALKGTDVKVLVDGGIHIHCHGEAAAGLGLCHLLFNSVDVPRLDGRHAAAIGIADGLGGHGHDVGVGAIAGEGGNTALGAGAHQHIVVGHVGVGIGVVEVHRAHRASEEGVLEAAAEQLHVGIGGAVLAEGIHVHTDVGPFIIIADGGVAHALCAGAGDLILAGHAVAHRAGLAVFADTLPRVV